MDDHVRLDGLLFSEKCSLDKSVHTDANTHIPSDIYHLPVLSLVDPWSLTESNGFNKWLLR